MFHPTKIFSRFSKEKFKAAKFKTKAYFIWRIVWALFAMFIVLPPLVLLVWLLQTIYNLVDSLADKITSDSIMRLIYQGLTSEPVMEKEQYTVDVSNIVRGASYKEVE